MSMIAINDIKEGQQIYNDFGHLPRSDLLRRYGFVTDRYKQWDVVEVPIEIVVRVVAEHNPLTKSEKKQRVISSTIGPRRTLTSHSSSLRQTGRYFKTALT